MSACKGTWPWKVCGARGSVSGNNCCEGSVRSDQKAGCGGLRLGGWAFGVLSDRSGPSDLLIGKLTSSGQPVDHV